MIISGMEISDDDVLAMTAVDSDGLFLLNQSLTAKYYAEYVTHYYNMGAAYSFDNFCIALRLEGKRLRNA